MCLNRDSKDTMDIYYLYALFKYYNRARVVILDPYLYACDRFYPIKKSVANSRSNKNQLSFFSDDVIKS